MMHDWNSYNRHICNVEDIKSLDTKTFSLNEELMIGFVTFYYCFSVCLQQCSACAQVSRKLQKYLSFKISDLNTTIKINTKTNVHLDLEALLLKWKCLLWVFKAPIPS